MSGAFQKSPVPIAIIVGVGVAAAAFVAYLPQLQQAMITKPVSHFGDYCDRPESATGKKDGCSIGRYGWASDLIIALALGGAACGGAFAAYKLGAKSAKAQ